MRYELLKKVNEPISFKGFKGVYLIKSLYLIGVSALLIIAVFITVSHGLSFMISLCTIISVLIYFLSNFKKKSKTDYYINFKQGANKNIQFGGVPINYKDLLNND